MAGIGAFCAMGSIALFWGSTLGAVWEDHALVAGEVSHGPGAPRQTAKDMQEHVLLIFGAVLGCCPSEAQCQGAAHLKHSAGHTGSADAAGLAGWHFLSLEHSSWQVTQQGVSRPSLMHCSWHGLCVPRLKSILPQTMICVAPIHGLCGPDSVCFATNHDSRAPNPWSVLALSHCLLGPTCWPCRGHRQRDALAAASVALDL